MRKEERKGGEEDMCLGVSVQEGRGKSQREFI